VVERQVILTDELKTKTSHRTLPLIPPVEELLLRHKAKIEENKAFYGNVYDKRYLDYVCVEEDGKIVYPDHLTKKFADLVKENGLRHIRLHDLRHSCASNMLASGVPLKEIQEWLGHSDFSTTANVYSHLDFSFKIKAANTILSAYSDEQPIVKKESELSLLEKASQEMKALGFTSIEEYLAYKAK
jgi:integrase